ncbi:MAG: acyltransferase [Bacteroidetes bacterium]|nr:acyltransferase [Bacteroidota bacterium]
MHKNNFDFLRLVFALCVIITHSYTLTGAAETDWLHTLTNGQVFFSYIGVRGFFIISGYLIYQSLLRSKSFYLFYWHRILRIFPGLIVVLLLTVILGYFVYAGDFHSYITNKSVWTYFPNNIKLFRLQGTIQGIFENNPYKDDINGSIWTLGYEFICYVLISLLFFIKRGHLIILSVVCLFFFVSNIFFLDVFSKLRFVIFAENIIDFGTFFFAGSLLAVLKIEKWKNRNLLLVISNLLLLISLYFGVFRIVHQFAMPVAIILFGITATKYIRGISKKVGDMSYGIYIYAFVIQQTLVHFFKIEQFSLTIYASLISIVFGYLSWHLIEKQALKFKNQLPSF